MKKCKGTGKAKSHGCNVELKSYIAPNGIKSYRGKYGLGLDCGCYNKWLSNTEQGKKEIQKAKIKSKKEINKNWNNEKKVLKEKLKTKSDHEKELQIIINQIAREIDKGHNCLMCGNVPKKKNGCHYHSVGSNSTLRFNLFNIWLGCESCNKWKGGNINGYDNELIKHFGKDKWEYIKFELVRDYVSLHLSIIELKELKIKSKKILKEVKELPKLDFNERWELRVKINSEIGIYPEWMSVFKLG